MKTKYLIVGAVLLLTLGIFSFNFFNNNNSNNDEKLVPFAESNIAREIVNNGNGVIVENPFFKKPELFPILNKKLVGNYLEVNLYDSVMQREEEYHLK